MKSDLKHYLATIGRRGGQATGESKVRGGADYYRELGKRSARQRRKRKDKP